MSYHVLLGPLVVGKQQFLREPRSTLRAVRLGVSSTTMTSPKESVELMDTVAKKIRNMNKMSFLIPPFFVYHIKALNTGRLCSSKPSTNSKKTFYLRAQLGSRFWLIGVYVVGGGVSVVWASEVVEI